MAFDSTGVKFCPQFAAETTLFPVSASWNKNFATRPCEKTLSVSVSRKNSLQCAF
jgi:hypothetical protein